MQGRLACSWEPATEIGHALQFCSPCSSLLIAQRREMRYSLASWLHSWPAPTQPSKPSRRQQSRAIRLRLEECNAGGALDIRLSHIAYRYKLESGLSTGPAP